MAYNNYFPTGYMPQYYAPTQYQNSPTQMSGTSQAQSGIIWVQGEAGAKSYLVAPNTTVQLWDSEAQVIYLKSADASGMPSIKTLDYTIRNTTPTVQQAAMKTQDNNNYVTKNEFDAFKHEVQKMIGVKENESTVSANDE